MAVKAWNQPTSEMTVEEFEKYEPNIPKDGHFPNVSLIRVKKKQKNGSVFVVDFFLLIVNVFFFFFRL